MTDRRKPRPAGDRVGADRDSAGRHGGNYTDREARRQAIAAAADREIDSDRRFFRRRPRRCYRVRRAFPNEIREFVEIGGMPEAPEGTRVFVAVRAVSRENRIRVPFLGASWLDTDVPDEAAREMFHLVMPPRMAEVVRTIEEWSR